jgi:hypothetical protein
LRRKRIEPIQGVVRSLGTILGAARDLDVLQTELLDPAIGALGEAEHLAPLLASLAAKKAEAYQQVSPGGTVVHALSACCAVARSANSASTHCSSRFESRLRISSRTAVGGRVKCCGVWRMSIAFEEICLPPNYLTVNAPP